MQCKAFQFITAFANGNIYRNLNTCIFIQLGDECVLCTTDPEDWIQSLLVYYFFCLFSKESVSAEQSGFHQRCVFFSVQYNI